LELFRSEDEHHILSVFVVKQIVEVWIIQRREVFEKKLKA
jgi:hypothetical protein